VRSSFNVVLQCAPVTQRTLLLSPSHRAGHSESLPLFLLANYPRDIENRSIAIVLISKHYVIDCFIQNAIDVLRAASWLYSPTLSIPKKEQDSTVDSQQGQPGSGCRSLLLVD
jgi:hypothetical protein